MKRIRKRNGILIGIAILMLGFTIPENLSIPVRGATRNSWNKNSFWYYPWGKSGTHKGIDIFANENTPVLSSSPGIVLYTGTMGRGGNVVLVLGPKWRLHYYAHLETINTKKLSLVSGGEPIGEVGTTGNAAGKPPHLHYSILTLIPYPWRIDFEKQGWKKMFYLDPGEHLKK